jgi:hypothetical protein
MAALVRGSARAVAQLHLPEPDAWREAAECTTMPLRGMTCTSPSSIKRSSA